MTPAERIAECRRVERKLDLTREERVTLERIRARWREAELRMGRETSGARIALVPQRRRA